MQSSLNRWPIILSVLLALVVAALVVLFFLSQNLGARSNRIVAGMPRAEVEAILGPPVLELRRQSGNGRLLVWVDQLWQVDVTIDSAGRAEKVSRMPSDSAYRRAVNMLIPTTR